MAGGMMPFREIEQRIQQRKFEEELRKFPGHMPISTIETVPGYGILEFKGYVQHAELFSLGDISKLDLDGAVDKVLEETVKKTRSLGGNAIVGFKVTYCPFSPKGIISGEYISKAPMLIVSCVGTAVKVAKK